MSSEEQYEYFKQCIHAATQEALGRIENTKRTLSIIGGIGNRKENKKKKNQNYLSGQKETDIVKFVEAQARARK